MKYNQDRLEQSIKYLFKIQLGAIIMALIAVIVSGFATFNGH